MTAPSFAPARQVPDSSSRNSVPTLRVLGALRAAGEPGLVGIELMTACHLRSGTIYPMLDRLYARGLIAEHRTGHRAHVYLTEAGHRAWADGVAWVRRQHAAALARLQEMDALLAEIGAEDPEPGAAG